MGLTVPVHGPGGELAAVGFNMDRAPPEARPLIVTRAPLCQLLAIRYHAGARRRLGGGSHSCPRLTERQAECLRWTARGKTSSGIAGILGISERTVNFHLSKAGKNLGAVNRVHAVAKALASGLITV